MANPIRNTLFYFTMTQEEIQFIQQHYINFETTKLGYARNIGHDVLATYERLYRKYLDSSFILTYWCGSCVLEMLERLVAYYEANVINQPMVTIEAVPEPVPVETTKKKRSKK